MPSLSLCTRPDSRSVEQGVKAVATISVLYYVRHGPGCALLLYVGEAGPRNLSGRGGVLAGDALFLRSVGLRVPGRPGRGEQSVCSSACAEL